MDWVPRSVRARARDIERAIASLEAQLPRAPTDEEIAGKLGMTRGGARRGAARDLALVDRRARRAVVEPDRLGRRGVARRHDRGPARPRARQASSRRRSCKELIGEAISRAARAREARHHALLLRGAHAAGDRRGARRHRVARVAAPHQGDPAPQSAAGGARRSAPRSSARRCVLGAAAGVNSTPPNDTRGTRLLAHSRPSTIRNVAVVGHRGTGKTSLVEALALPGRRDEPARDGRAGLHRLGLGRGRAQRQMSLSASLCHLDWQGDEDQPDRHPGRRRLPGRHARRATRRRGRARAS